MTTTTIDDAPQFIEPTATAPRNYLNNEYGILSWLLTRDHKRIGILYLISVSVMFFVGGMFAFLLRLELLTPEGDLFTSDTYNKFFTLHGIVMIFFFLIPAIPAVLGNFILPIMLGAKDLAFPKINLLSWYLYIFFGKIALVSVLFTNAFAVTARARRGSLHPRGRDLLLTNVILAAAIIAVSAYMRSLR